jgi:hypothetical protein
VTVCPTEIKTSCKESGKTPSTQVSVEFQLPLVLEVTAGRGGRITKEIVSPIPALLFELMRSLQKAEGVLGTVQSNEFTEEELN